MKHHQYEHSIVCSARLQRLSIVEGWSDMMEIGTLGVGIAGIPHRPDYSMKKVSCVLPQKALLHLVIAKVPIEKYRDSEHLGEHTKDLTTSW